MIYAVPHQVTGYGLQVTVDSFELSPTIYNLTPQATGHSTLPIRQAQGSLSDSRRLRDEPSGSDLKRRSV